MKFVLIFLCILLTLSFGEYPDDLDLPVQENVLQTLNPDHPRLYITHEKIIKLQSDAAKDTLLHMYIQNLLDLADSFLEDEPVDYVIVGPRLLTQSRRCLNRVTTLGMAFQLTRDPKYALRAKRELFAAAAFPDWNPSHFLDTAEMSCAFGIGYDWFYNEWSEYDRMVIREALVEKGLEIGKKAYEGAEFGWWTTVHHNWNQVCNGGLSVGALAIADEEPEIAAFILDKAIHSLPLAMLSYAPDGGWNEGPGYWSYATQYTTYMLAALQSALGKDFGLSTAPGFDQCGYFPIYGAGPQYLYFNFADAGTRAGPNPAFFYLAHQFNQPFVAMENHHRLLRRLEKRHTIKAFDLAWYYAPEKVQNIDLNAYYKGVQTVFMRTDWQDKNAWFVGFKGGDNQANHSHLDIGSFVLDALGTRWAVDLGSDNYNMPNYFDAVPGGERWKYFRLINYSHNTLTLNGHLQKVKAVAPIEKYRFSNKKNFAIADLTKAYREDVISAKRGIQLLSNAAVIQDEIEWNSNDRQLCWNVTTDAEIELDENVAALHKNGKILYAKILQPASAVFKTVSPEQQKPQNPNKGYTQLAVDVQSDSPEIRLVVVFTKDPEFEMKIKPLRKW